MSAILATALAAALAGQGGTLASGTFGLPAARAFGEPGFHQVIVVTGRIRRRVPKGARLVVSLRDAGRPGMSCSSEHPLSGCATVDWSDDPGRPKVPAGGVFENSLAIGGRKLYLSESGVLARRPDRYTPG